MRTRTICSRISSKAIGANGSFGWKTAINPICFVLERGRTRFRSREGPTDGGAACGHVR